MDFVQRFAELLEAKNITSYRLSKDLGFSEGMIAYWRKGERLPSLESAVLLADYFNVSLDELVGRTKRMESSR